MRRNFLRLLLLAASLSAASLAGFAAVSVVTPAASARAGAPDTTITLPASTALPVTSAVSTTVPLPTTTVTVPPVSTTLPNVPTTTVTTPVSTTVPIDRPATTLPEPSTVTVPAAPGTTTGAAPPGQTPGSARPESAPTVASDGSGAPSASSPSSPGAEQPRRASTARASGTSNAPPQLFALVDPRAVANGSSALLVALDGVGATSDASGRRAAGSAPLFQERANALSGVPLLGTAGDRLQRSEKSQPSALGFVSELEDLPGAGAFLIAVGLGFLAFVIALNSLPRLAAAGRVPLSRAAEDKVHELAFIVGAAVFGLILGLLIAYANG